MNNAQRGGGEKNKITHSSPCQSVCNYSNWRSGKKKLKEELDMKRKPNIHSLARLCLGIIQSDTPWSNTAQEKITNAGSAVSLRNNKAEYKTCTRSLLLPHTFNEDPPLADSLKQQRDAWK